MFQHCTYVIAYLAQLQEQCESCWPRMCRTFKFVKNFWRNSEYFQNTQRHATYKHRIYKRFSWSHNLWRTVACSFMCNAFLYRHLFFPHQLFNFHRFLQHKFWRKYGSPQYHAICNTVHVYGRKGFPYKAISAGMNIYTSHCIHWIIKST